MKKISKEEMLKDSLNLMDTAYEEFINLISPVMHTNLKYREAVKFVQSGNLIKSLNQIKKIILSHQYLWSSYNKKTECSNVSNIKSNSPESLKRKGTGTTVSNLAEQVDDSLGDSQMTKDSNIKADFNKEESN